MTTADLKSSSFMVRALSVGGGWNFHSRRVPRATRQAQGAINSEAHQMAREVA
jgi:hypothetical protein